MSAGSERRRGGQRLADDRMQPAAPHGLGEDRRAGQRGAHPRPLDRQPRLGQAPPDQGQQQCRLGHPGDAAQERRRVTASGRSGLRPDASLTSPSAARTAAAQWSRLWTRIPFRSAIPPSLSIGRAHAASPIVRATCRKQRDRQLEVVHRSPLVGRVDERPGEHRVHPHRHEPVGDGAERLAHEVAVGEAGVHDRRQRRPGLDLGAKSSIARKSGVSGGEACRRRSR